MHRLPFLSHSDVTSPHRYDEPLPRLLEARRTRRTAEANPSLRTSNIRVRDARQYSSLRFVCVMHGSGAQPPMPSRPFHHTKQDNAAGLVTPPCPASQASARALTVRTARGCYWSGELMLLLDFSGTSHPISVASSACAVAQSHDRLSTIARRCGVMLSALQYADSHHARLLTDCTHVCSLPTKQKQLQYRSSSDETLWRKPLHPRTSIWYVFA
jgi:hypothetical protein